MSTGFLALALTAFGVGMAVRRSRPPAPPTLPMGPGLGGWRIADGIYLPLDLGVAAFLIGFYALLPLVAMAATDLDAASMEIGVTALVMNAAVQFFLTAMVIGVVAWRRHPVDWLGLNWKPVPVVLTVLIVLGAGMVATMATGYFVYGLEALGYQDWLLHQLGHETEEEAVQEVVKAFSEAESPATLVMLCVTAVLVAPITEEVIFRGYLYPVAKRFAGRWAAVLFSSLLFAMVHQNAMALVPLAFLAVLLALSYEFTGSIWAPIGIHMVFNGTTVFMQIAQRMEWISLPEG